MKALQLVSSTASKDSYNAIVYCWDTVHGVRAFSFSEFLVRFLTPPHDDTINFQRVSGVSFCAELEAADLKYIQTHAKERDNRGIHIQMAFRTLWYATTREVLEIGDDQSV